MSKNKKIKKYGLLRFLIILAVLGFGFLIYVTICLFQYESNVNYQDNFINELRKASKKGTLSKYFKLNNIENEYESKPSLSSGYKELLKGDVKYERSKNENIKLDKDEEAYDIIADDIVICTVKFKRLGIKRCLGILSYENYEVSEVIADNTDGLFNIDIYAPVGAKVLVNDKELSVDNTEIFVEKVNDKVFNDTVSGDNIPANNHFHISKLTKKPTVKMIMNDKELVVNNDNYTYTTDIGIKVGSLEEVEALLGVSIDPISFVEDYALFMTYDLNGSERGFGSLKKRVVEGTKFYTDLYNWAHGVDITFVSDHFYNNTIEKFSDVKMSNFVVYGNTAFTVDISLSHNFIINISSRPVHNNKYNDRYAFVKDGNVVKAYSKNPVTEKSE